MRLPGDARHATDASIAALGDVPVQRVNDAVRAILRVVGGHRGPRLGRAGCVEHGVRGWRSKLLHASEEGWRAIDEVAAELAQSTTREEPAEVLRRIAERLREQTVGDGGARVRPAARGGPVDTDRREVVMPVDLRGLRGMAQDRMVLAELYMERVRQRDHGYDAVHDDDHDAGEIADAAVVLIDYDVNSHGPRWAYDLAYKTREDRRKQLVIAAALLVAEIERLDRVAEQAPILTSRTPEPDERNQFPDDEPEEVPEPIDLVDVVAQVRAQNERLDALVARLDAIEPVVEATRKDVFDVLQRHP